jgi:asparagine synthase (glutamine-hydrolysing)
MCGIIGFISKKNTNANYYNEKFNFYHKKLFHRGPDFQEKINITIEQVQVSLGFSRLAIQDTSLEGNKIFKNQNYIILFNGEIYNFMELRLKYLPKEKFETKTDTEVLFKLFLKYGDDFIKYIEGIFSIVVIDLKKIEVKLFKDFTGTKPLYYFINADGLFFCSEAWFLYSISSKELNYKALTYYFKFGFSPIDETLIKRVYKVSPGQKITYNFSQNNTKKEQFFNLKITKNKNNKFDIKELEYDLLTVVKKNLISDAKIGIFLSGGIDSSLLALLAKNLNIKIEAFTSFFLPENKYKKFNIDYDYSKRICNDHNIVLNRVELDQSDVKIKSELINFLSNLDEPLPNMNILNSYLQAKAARINGCKVIITGDGADEIFGGYGRYRFAFYANKFRFLSFLNKKISNFNSIKKKDIPIFFYEKISKSFNKIFTKEIMTSIYNFEFDYFLPDVISPDIINYFDLKYWIPEESNYKLDRSLMANSVEGRVPFQDVNIINKYFDIPFEDKISIFDEKIPLKKIKIIPDYVKLRKKHGWFAPETSYLKGYFNDLFVDNFQKKNVIEQNIFNYDNLLKIYLEHGIISNYKKELTTILCFQVWYNNLLNNH